MLNLFEFQKDHISHAARKITGTQATHTHTQSCKCSGAHGIHARMLAQSTPYEIAHTLAGNHTRCCLTAYK